MSFVRCRIAFNNLERGPRSVMCLDFICQIRRECIARSVWKVSVQC